ncbi:ankyrin [Nemania abortiva]|nr:ankyrin [Nemania abortiva]
MATRELNWDTFYDEIRKLYLVEDKSPKEITSIFKEKHSLNVTPRQLIKKLNDWGLRKNLNKGEWKYVGHQVKKHERRGQYYEVFLSGERLPSTKIRKGLTNYRFDLSSRYNIPRSPSPTSPDSELLVFTLPSRLGNKWPHSLPWWWFQSQIEQYFDLLLQRRDDMPWPQILNSPNAHALLGLLNSHEARDTVVARQHHIGETHRFLSKYMPESILGEHAKRANYVACQQRIPRRMLTILEVILFLISNNISGCDSFGDVKRQENTDNDIITMFEALDLMGCPWKRLFLSKEPTATALADKIFASTVRLGRVDILQKLIKMGVNLQLRINRPIRYPVSYPHSFHRTITPIQVALVTNNLAMAKALLNNGADLDPVTADKHYRPSIFYALHSIPTARDGSLDVKRCVVNFVLHEQRHIDEAHLINGLARFIGSAFPGNVSESVVTLILDRLFQMELSTRLQFPCIALAFAIHFNHASLIESLVLSGRGITSNLALDKAKLLLPLEFEYLTPIIEATRLGDYELCETLLKGGAKPDSSSRTTPSALQYAALQGNIDILRLLLVYGADPDRNCSSSFDLRVSWGSHSTTALRLAVLESHLDIVQALLDAGAKPSRDDLWEAIQRGNVVVTRQLLSKDIKPDGQDLARAESMGNKQLIDLLIEYGAKSDDSEESSCAILPGPLDSTSYDPVALVEAVYMAGRNGTSRVDDVLYRRKLLGKNSCHPHRKSFESIAVAVSVLCGDVATCSVLGRHGLLQRRLDFRGIRHDPSFLWLLTRRGQLDGLDISMNFDEFPCCVHFQLPSQRESVYISAHSLPSPLSVAFKAKIECMVDLLLQHHVKPTEEDVYNSIEGSCVEECMRLLALIGKIEEESDRLLGKAISKGLEPVVEALINMNVDINQPFEVHDGPRTALQLACEKGQLEIVRLLISRGAQANAPAANNHLSYHGATALQFATVSGYLEIARMIIEAGGDCNAPAAETCGRTALEGAAEHGRLDMLKYLLECGTRTEGAFCRQYFRAIKFAEEETHYAAAQLLRDHRVWSGEDHEIFDRTCLCGYRITFEWCRYCWHEHGYEDNSDEVVEIETSDECEVPGVLDNSVNGQVLQTGPVPEILQPAHDDESFHSWSAPGQNVSEVDENSSTTPETPHTQNRALSEEDSFGQFVDVEQVEAAGIFIQ